MSIGLTKIQFQKQKTQQLKERQQRLVSKFTTLAQCAASIDRKYSDKPILNFEQHAELEQITDRITTQLSLLGNESMFPITEFRLDMSGNTLERLEGNLTKLETDLAHKTTP